MRQISRDKQDHARRARSRAKSSETTEISLTGGGRRVDGRQMHLGPQADGGRYGRLALTSTGAGNGSAFRRPNPACAPLSGTGMGRCDRFEKYRNIGVAGKIPCASLNLSAVMSSEMAGKQPERIAGITARQSRDVDFPRLTLTPRSDRDRLKWRERGDRDRPKWRESAREGWAALPSERADDNSAPRETPRDSSRRSRSLPPDQVTDWRTRVRGQSHKFIFFKFKNFHCHRIRLQIGVRVFGESLTSSKTFTATGSSYRLACVRGQSHKF
ncbi:hypothetical protein Bbelb_120850 [Branchiostoma belcheri]|nr:hypothetical protein Bbelb_120850 [Branchiostoma belcheri]